MNGVLWTLLVGLAAGVAIAFLARLIVPGREALTIGWTILIGVFAAVAGGFAADVLGWGYETGFDWRTLLVQLGVAVVVVTVFNIPATRRTRRQG
jgi:uncharacterized membrane protein YeaQ/YmgE (transglycosylase-associated protein family)